MSVINKEPYINKILKLLTAEELETLSNCINGEGPTPVFKSLVANSPYLLTTSDYGIYPVKLEIALQKSGLAQNVYLGYLIYKENGEADGVDLCALISYSGSKSQKLQLLVMHKNKNWSYEFKDCDLTILELRSQTNDETTSGEGGGGGSGDDSNPLEDLKFLKNLNLDSKDILSETDELIFPIEKIYFKDKGDENYTEYDPVEFREDHYVGNPLYLSNATIQFFFVMTNDENSANDYHVTVYSAADSDSQLFCRKNTPRFTDIYSMGVILGIKINASSENVFPEPVNVYITYVNSNA